MKNWNSHYKSLDYWRGFAALWVMLFHGLYTGYGKTVHPTVELLKIISQPGWLGVHIFFVISGYCIAASAYKIILKNQSPWYFLKNRLLRLFPVYWLALITTIAINLISSPFNSTNFWDNLPDTWQSWVGNIFLIQPYIQVPNYVVVYWSLVVEIAFYLLVTLLLITAKIFTKNTALFIALTLAFISPFVYIQSISFINFWCEFICGCLLFGALMYQHNNQKYKKNLSLLIIFILIIISAFLSILGKSNNQLWYSGVFSLVLYLMYKFDNKISDFSPLNWLKFIGTMSYSLYLLHVPFQGRLINLGKRFIEINSLEYLFLQIAGWFIAIAVSYTFYILAEKPLNEWRYNFLKSRSSLQHHNSHFLYK